MVLQLKGTEVMTKELADNKELSSHAETKGGEPR
jgi:hypothetical protein